MEKIVPVRQFYDECKGLASALLTNFKKSKKLYFKQFSRNKF